MRYAELLDEPYEARLALKTAATVEPVSVEQLTKHSRVDPSEDATYMAALIATARQWCEQYTGRQFNTATWTLVLNDFPRADCFELPRPPLLTVSTVKYLDANHVLQTVAASVYNVHAFAGPQAPAGYIELAIGQAWPPTYLGDGAVEIEFTAGYGAAAADVPAQIRQAILLHAGEMYERREQVIVGNITSPVAITVERLLWPLRHI